MDEEKDLSFDGGIDDSSNDTSNDEQNINDIKLLAKELIK